MMDDERKRLAVVAANAHTRWALRTNTSFAEAPDTHGWEEIARAVATEVRRQEREKVAALVDAAEQILIDLDQEWFRQLGVTDLDVLRAALVALEEQP